MPGTHSNANGSKTPRALAIYLKDHHAAGSAGARLAARLAENVSPAVEARNELARVAQEVQEDLHTLERVMLAEQVRPNATKDTLAKGLELLGRFKLNGRVTGRAPLSDVIELETLLVGITGKAALWRSLSEGGTRASVDFDELLRRADAQQATVSRYRDRAASRAFARRFLTVRPRYSASDSPEPPSSAGKSFSFGRPSFIGSTVDS